ncbi:MAG: LacI family DNA-binding transcriptional regulator [Blastocatellia bacterium]
MPTTLADIAEALGISKMTVSRAINDDPNINAATRERVLEVARQMSYQPNLQARGLTTNRSYLLGLIVPDLMHSYYAEIANAVAAMARPAGYEILICNTEEDAEKETAEVDALRRRTDGLIIASAVPSGKAGVYRKLIREGARIVLLDRGFDRVSCPVVLTDNLLVGRMATEHLIKLGHRRIGHLRGPRVSVAEDRLEGYRRALANASIPYDEKLVRACGFRESDGHTAMQAWLEEGHLPTAVFAINDPVAIGAMQALHKSRVKIPRDMALVGAGAIHYGDLLRVPLTTVNWDTQEMGRQAARLLLEMIDEKGGKNGPRQPVIIKPELVVRESCGAGGKHSGKK